MDTLNICESSFNKTIERSNKPLVGLEYIIEFEDCDNVLKPFYCALCDIHCDESGLLFNLVSHEHIINYLELNFPSIMKILDANKKFNLDSNYRENILTSISAKLQIYLKVPQVKRYSLRTFEACKSRITKSIKIMSSQFSEKSFQNPKVLLEGVNLDDDIPSTSLTCCLEIPNSSLKSRLKKFYEKLEIEEAKVHEAYKNYRLVPESHPLYFEEWNDFYNRKQINMLTCPISKTANYDFKQDWIQYWVIRSEELHYDEINKLRIQIREEFNLSQDAIRRDEEEKMDKITGKSKSRNRHLDDSDSDKYVESCIRDPRIPRKKRRQRCPIEKLHSMSNEEVIDPKRYEYDAPGSVFIICRQLLAIQDEIEVFEYAIRSLYMKAAVMEKIKFYSSEELLMDDEAFRLFQTLRDKLRNAIDKKILDVSKVRCALRTAQLMTGMIYQTEFRKAKRFDNIKRNEDRKRSQSSSDSKNNTESKVTQSNKIVETDVSKKRRLNIFNN